MDEAYTIVDDSVWRADDQRLVALLQRVYVEGGFTDAVLAATLFTPHAVRARGRLLCARDGDGILVEW